MGYLKYVAMMLLAAVLTACGGGGGSAGTSSGGSGSGSGSGSGTGTGTSTAKPTITLQLRDSANAAATSVSQASGNYVLVTVKDAKGDAVPSQLVTLTPGSDLVTLDVTSNTAITGSDGTVKVNVYPSPGTKGGATSISASATVASTAISATQSFSVATAPNVVTVGIYDASGNPVVTLDPTCVGCYTAKAKVRDNVTGAVVSGAIVTFSLDAAIASFSTATVTSNGTGDAGVGIRPISSLTTSTTLRATTSVNGQVFQGSTAFVAQASASSGGTASTVMTLSLRNSSNAVTSNVTYGGGNYVQVDIATGAAAEVNKVVTFSLGSGLASFTPSSATALTGDGTGGSTAGRATIQIAPSSPTSAGATTLTASAVINGVTVSQVIGISVSASSVTLSPITLGSTSLASGGNTSATVTATAGGIPVPGVSINFSADCGTITTPVTTNGSGVASSTYASVPPTGTTLCSGPVVISATSGNSTPVNNTVTVAAPVAKSITYVSPTTKITVGGSGSNTQATVTFKVLTATGVALANQDVRLSLPDNINNVKISTSSGAASTGTIVGQTNASGLVDVVVYSGVIPGPVQLRAELVSDPTVFATSTNLSVASGPPAQERFDLSVSTFNIEGWNISGTATTLTMNVADHYGNPVPDGTTINFVAEGGQVESRCFTTTSAATNTSGCKVSLISQIPRPAGGRVSVLAYADGHKEWQDAAAGTAGNTMGQYDPGVDTIIDQGDAYRDDDEDGVYNVTNDRFVIPNPAPLVACAGRGAPVPSVVNTCTGTGLATKVRAQTVIMFSSSHALVVDAGSSASVIRFYVSSVDNPLLPMPSGSTVSLSPLVSGCTVTSTLSGTPIGNIGPGTDPTANLRTFHAAGLSAGCTGTVINVVVTPPSGAGSATTTSILIP